jgi:hypothetical protein
MMVKYEKTASAPIIAFGLYRDEELGCHTEVWLSREKEIVSFESGDLT